MFRIRARAASARGGFLQQQQGSSLMRRRAAAVCLPSQWQQPLPEATASSLPQQQHSRRHQVWCDIPLSVRWQCASPKCMAVNIAARNTCLRCGDKRPFIDGWKCPRCERINGNKLTRCRNCAGPFVMPTEWQCPCCKNQNKVDGFTPGCSQCSYSCRPEATNVLETEKKPKKVTPREPAVSVELAKKRAEEREAEEKRKAEEEAANPKPPAAGDSSAASWDNPTATSESGGGGWGASASGGSGGWGDAAAASSSSSGWGDSGGSGGGAQDAWATQPAAADAGGGGWWGEGGASGPTPISATKAPAAAAADGSSGSGGDPWGSNPSGDATQPDGSAAATAPGVGAAGAFDPNSVRLGPDGKPLPPRVIQPVFDHPDRRPEEPVDHVNVLRKVESSAAAATLPSAVPKDLQLGAPGFDWMCRNATCGTINDGATDSCRACLTKVNPSNWLCEMCASINFKLRAQCFNCNSQIPLSWQCDSCHKKTSVYDTKCRSCNADRPKVKPTLGKGGISLIQIAIRARERKRYENLRAASAAQGGSGSGPTGDWVCTQCHKLNYQGRESCISCEAARPAASGFGTSPLDPDGGHTYNVPVGDSNWTCLKCQATNFRTRADCWQCGAQSADGAINAGIDEQMGTAPAIEQEGFQAEAPARTEEEEDERKKKWVSEWSAGDGQSKIGDAAEWICAKCMHKNFKENADCFKCFAPKTVAEVSPLLHKQPEKKKVHKI